MTESPESSTIKRLRDHEASFRMTEHDARLFRDDAVVNQVAHVLAQIIIDYGVAKCAAAFRASLVIARQARR